MVYWLLCFVVSSDDDIGEVAPQRATPRWRRPTTALGPVYRDFGSLVVDQWQGQVLVRRDDGYSRSGT